MLVGHVGLNSRAVRAAGVLRGLLTMARRQQ